MQSFALAVAMLCVGSCNALRWRLQSFASETGKTGIEIVSPILDNRKGKKDSPYGPLSPQEISAEPLFFLINNVVGSTRYLHGLGMLLDKAVNMPDPFLLQYLVDSY